MSVAAQILDPQSASGGNTKPHPTYTINSALWTMQLLWGIFFSFTGFGKVLCFNHSVWNQMLPRVPWFSAVPQALFVFIGICEFLAAVGLIVPAMTRVKPKLTPLAAFGLTLVMILAAVFHILRREYNFFLPCNLVLAGGAAFIAGGRLFVRPITPASISTLRVLKALVVLGALALVGFLPVWYQLTHTH